MSTKHLKDHESMKCTTTSRLVSVLMTIAFTSASIAAEHDWRFTDIEGKVHKPFDETETRGIALIFISTDCPIANSYQPLLQRMAREYVDRGMRFFLIHPIPDLTIEQARNPAREFMIETPVVIDANLSIASRVGATNTPQAFVYSRDGRTPAYQGRIDNRFAGYGKKRNVATSHDLAAALESIVTGRPVSRPKTKPIGCFLSYPKDRTKDHFSADQGQKSD